MIKEKIEQAQTSKVMFQITADELTEFVKQLSAGQVTPKSAPVVPTKVQNSPSTPKVAPVPSKSYKELQEKIEKLTARVESLENVIIEGKPVLNTEEAAIFLGIAKSSLYKMTHEHIIPFYRPNGKIILFEKEELLKWMRSCRVASEKEIDEAAKLKMRELALKSLKRNK